MNESTIADCAPGCPCACHTDVEDPGPHRPVCLWSDPNFPRSTGLAVLEGGDPEARLATATKRESVEAIGRLVGFERGARFAPIVKHWKEPCTISDAHRPQQAGEGCSGCDELDAIDSMSKEERRAARAPVCAYCSTRTLRNDKGECMKCGHVALVDADDRDMLHGHTPPNGTPSTRCPWMTIASATQAVRCMRDVHEDAAHDFRGSPLVPRGEPGEYVGEAGYAAALAEAAKSWTPEERARFTGAGGGIDLSSVQSVTFTAPPITAAEGERALGFERAIAAADATAAKLALPASMVSAPAPLEAPVYLVIVHEGGGMQRNPIFLTRNLEGEITDAVALSIDATCIVDHAFVEDDHGRQVPIRLAKKTLCANDDLAIDSTWLASHMRPTRHRPWFLTLTGRQFFYDDPESYPFTITEIAHALSNLCRFAGHLREFYSVAEHSVLVAQALEREALIVLEEPGDLRPLLRAALLHDASEAFLMDLPRPLKRLPGLDGYRLLEDRVQLAILRTFGLEDYHAAPGGDHKAIKRADTAVLAAEKNQLRDPHTFGERADIDGGVKSAAVTCRSLSPTLARAVFLATWQQLGGV